MRLLVVSICKNEAATITELIKRVPRRIKGVKSVDVLVINDGSGDDTAKLAKKAGATVIGDDHSKGLAVRFREASEYALEHDYDVMVNIDGDLQFSPEDIPKFALPIVNDEADFVAADRFTDPETGAKRKPANMPSSKYYGNKAGAWVVSKLSGQKFRDVTCGFRGYNRDALYGLNINTKKTYTQESFQLMAAKNMRIKTVPVKVEYFEGRKSRVVTSIPGYVIGSGLNILRAFRDFAPLRFFVMLGAIPFVIGLGCLLFLVVHWLQAGQFTPYKFVGFTGLYFVTLGIFFWILAIVADMQVRVLANQEKTYEELRRLAHKINKRK